MSRFWLLWLTAGLFWACEKKNSGIRPTEGPVTEAVYASGKIRAYGQYNVYPTVTGILEKVHAEAGDTVTKGQLLFEIGHESPELNSENARLALSLSETNSGKESDRLGELEEAVKLAGEKLRLDSSLLARQKNLWNQKIGTRAELDQRRLAFESSRSALETARNRLSQLRIQLRNELERARVNYRLSRNQVGDFEVRSRLNGLAFDILRSEGELVNPQTPLAVLGEPGREYLELQVNEADIARVRRGMPAEVSMDGFRGKIFRAEITRIYPIMNEKTRNFRVEAHFLERPEPVYPNMNVEANLVIRKKEKALTIPRRYLIAGRFVVLAGGEQREVKTGLQDYQKVEIVSGIDAGTEIFAPR